jgi:hypothetical protein
MFQELYSKAGIGVPFEDMETNDVVIFGVMVAEFLADFRHSPTQLLPSAFFYQCLDSNRCFFHPGSEFFPREGEFVS